MIRCIGGFCPDCGQNIFLDIDDKKFYGCNTPKQKGFEDNKNYNGGWVKSEFTCKRCGKKETIFAEKKVSKNRKYCNACNLELDKIHTEKYLLSKKNNH